MTNYRPRVYNLIRKEKANRSRSKLRTVLFRNPKAYIFHSIIGGSVMQYYDARIIENCCVFSYEVKTPDRSGKKNRKRKTASAWKKTLLRFILLLMLPFTFLRNCVKRFSLGISRRLRNFFGVCSHCRALTACIISSVSATALIPLAFLIL